MGFFFSLVSLAVGSEYTHYLEINALDQNIFTQGIFLFFKQDLAHAGTDDRHFATIAHIQVIDESSG